MKIQLAKTMPLEKVTLPCVAEIKLDGVRLIAVNTAGKVYLFTRNEKLVHLPRLSAELGKSHLQNWVLDGELCYVSGKQEDRPKVSGIVNSAIHGGLVSETNLSYQVFDAMRSSDWESSTCDGTYSQRLGYLADIYSGNKISPVLSHRVVPKIVTSVTQIKSLYDHVVNHGYEGLILKQQDHLYTFNRSKAWVKLKEVRTADLTCIGYNKGKGKYESMVGSLICKGDVEGKRVIVNVAGICQANAKAMLDSIGTGTSVVGQTVEVLYNSVTKDKTSGKHSLFLPRFVQVRFDK